MSSQSSVVSNPTTSSKLQLFHPISMNSRNAPTAIAAAMQILLACIVQIAKPCTMITHLVLVSTITIKTTK